MGVVGSLIPVVCCVDEMVVHYIRKSRGYEDEHERKREREEPYATNDEAGPDAPLALPMLVVMPVDVAIHL